MCSGLKVTLRCFLVNDRYSGAVKAARPAYDRDSCVVHRVSGW